MKSRRNQFLKDRQIEAMEAIFQLAKAADDGVTIGELTEVMKLAVKDGWDMLEIVLAMASNAARIAREERATG